MFPLIPTDPTLLVPSIDRSNATTPLVLLGYVVVSFLLLARGVKRSWLYGRESEASADRAEPDPASDHDPDDPLAENCEEAPP